MGAKKFCLNLSIIFLICLAGVLTYSNSFSGSFHMDDFPEIINNFAIRRINNLGNIWNFWPTRFITYLSIAFNYHLSGLEVFTYHAFNLTSHLITAILLWWLIKLTLNAPRIKNTPIASKSQPLAFFAAAFFLLHPVQTQTVNYIVQRAAILTALFYLSSLCLYAKARLKLEEKPPPQAHAWKACYLGSIIAAIISMFCKEISISLPLMIAVYEFCFFKNKNKSVRNYLLIFSGFILVIPLTLLLTKSTYLASQLGLSQDSANISSWHYLLTQLRVIVTYFRLSFVPINQNLDYDYLVRASLFKLPVVLSIFLLSAILFYAFKLLKKYTLVSFGIFWFLITLLPESSFFPLKNVIFEHRLYLPLAGFSIFMITGLYYLFQPKRFKLMVIMLCVTLAVYSFMTYQRNKVWKDGLTLWSDVIRKAPNLARPYIGRGMAYLKQDNLNQALSDFNKAGQINSNCALAYFNRGFIYYLKDNPEEAVVNFNKAVEINPYYADAYNNRGVVYIHQGKFNQAFLDINKAIEINPHYAKAYNNRGLIHAGYGNLNQALSDFNKAIEIDSCHLDAYYNRAVAYFYKKNYDKSWDDIHRAQELGYKTNHDFINELKKSSGRSK